MTEERTAAVTSRHWHFLKRCIFCGKWLSPVYWRAPVNAHVRCWLNDDEDGTL